MERLLAAAQARRDEATSVKTFDEMICSILLDRTGTKHFIVCMALSALIVEHCSTSVREHVANILDVCLFSESKTATEVSDVFMSSFTGRRTRGTYRRYTFEVSCTLEVWMAARVREFDELAGLQSDVVSEECLIESVKKKESTDFWRLQLRNEHDTNDYRVFRKKISRKTPFDKLDVLEGKESEALIKIWTFFRMRSYPGACEQYVKSLAQVTALFGSPFCDVIVLAELPKLYCEYYEVLCA